MKFLYFGLLAVISVSHGFELNHLQNGIDYPENNVGQRIIQGWPSAEGQFPHMVNLRMVNSAGAIGGCGGSLISPRWVLTAAHCLVGRSTVFVRMGSVNITTPGILIETKNLTVHPQYNANTLANDLGLINLGRDVEVTDRIRPIRLPRADQINITYAGDIVTASGWGYINDGGPNIPETMNFVNLTVISNTECRQAYPTIIINSTICAVGIQSTAQSTCNGDSGGALIYEEVDRISTQVGVISFVSSRGCSADAPSGYVRPVYFLDWINQVTGIPLRV